MEFFKASEPSDWECHLFGGLEGNRISWRPSKDEVPNFFWRWMQYLCFGNRWKRDKKELSENNH